MTLNWTDFCQFIPQGMNLIAEAVLSIIT